MKSSEIEILVSIAGLSKFDIKTVKDIILRIEYDRYISSQEFLHLSYIFNGLHKSLQTVLKVEDSFSISKMFHDKEISSKLLPDIFKEYLDTINPQPE